MKRCAACGEVKPRSEFHKLSRAADGLFYRCKPCALATLQKYREKRRAGNRSWYERNRTEYLAERAAQRTPERTRRKWLWERYRLTDEDYERMYAEQNGRCVICLGAHEKLNVDHDHETGYVRGLLCRKCNMGLGSFNDNPHLLLEGAHYLIRHGSADHPYEEEEAA